MLGVLLSIAIQAQDFPSPPFVRDKTYRFEELGRLGIFQDVIYLRHGDKIAAFDLVKEEVLWERPFEGEDYIDSSLITEQAIYISTDHFEDTDNFKLIAIDRKTGERDWELPRTSRGSKIVVHDGVLYTSMEPRSLSAIDLSDRSVRWVRHFGKDPQNEEERVRMETFTAVSGGHMFAAVRGENSYETVCFDAGSGEVVWRVGDSFSYGATPFVHNGAVVFTEERALTARDTKTGEALWTDDSRVPDFVGVFAGRLLVLADEVLRSIETRTGRTVWSFGSSEEGVISLGGGNDIYVTDGLVMVSNREGTFWLDEEGDVVWSLPVEPLPDDPPREGRGRWNMLDSPPRHVLPVWNDGERFVTVGSPGFGGFGRAGIRYYKTGTYPPLPKTRTERAALAVSLVNEIELLDEFEVQRLVSLGDDAFDPVFAAYLRRAAVLESMEFEDEIDKELSPLADVIGTLEDVLEIVFTPQRTGELTEAIEGLPEGHIARKPLVDIVSAQGDTILAAKFLLEKLKQAQPESLELYGELNSAITAISESHDPAAVEFMIGLLQNPRVETGIRQLAYRNLANTGGEAGLKAVLEERHSRRLLEPLLQRMGLDQLQAPAERFARVVLHDEKTDAQGRTWLLFTHNFLGDNTDLWIVEKTRDGYGGPLFTDAHTFDPSPGALSVIRKESEKFYGKTAKELLDGAWLESFVGNEEIERDTDGDGLTDLMEQRLGTDPEKADTDGDGDSDLVDPWPDTVPRELNEDEKLLAAVFEARYHFSGNATPGIMRSEEHEPFEMPGRAGWVMWRREDDTSRRLSELSSSYGRGMTSISFHETREYDEEYNDLPRTGNTINWNADHTEATVTISTYWGGLAGDGTMGRVKKFGDQWVVIEMGVRYVS